MILKWAVTGAFYTCGSRFCCLSAPSVFSAVLRRTYPEVFCKALAEIQLIVKAEAVPYYTWANRGVGEMRVWMNIAD